MPGERFAKVTRWFLYLLIGSIAVGAVLAIGIVLAGDWGWFETRILLSAVTIAVASIGGMACGAAMSRLSSPWLPMLGIATAILAATQLIAGMWLEVNDGTYWKYAASVSIVAATCAHVSLLSIARLAPAHTWVQVVAYVPPFLFATILVGIIFSETGNDDTLRILAVVGILDAALTLLVPVLHFLDRGAVAAVATGGATDTARGRDDVDAIDAEIERLRTRLAELEETRRLARGHYGDVESTR